MQDLYKYVGIVKNEAYEELKKLENKKLGITVKGMKAKIHGCFQTNFKTVAVIIDETVIGQTCNGTDFWDNESVVLEEISKFNLERK